jgi:ribosome maturation factor RimP
MLRAEKFGPFHADPVIGSAFFLARFRADSPRNQWLNAVLPVAPMQFAYEKLDGIERDRLHAAVDPVLVAHGVDAVELIWRTDNKGWVLSLTIEIPGRALPGEGVTVDLCASISRDLSVALDVAELLPHKYRLEVGSPGLERALYRPDDYARFAGQSAKLKLREPHSGQKVLSVKLGGLDADGNVVVETENGQCAVAYELIQTGHLVFDWRSPGTQRAKRDNKSRARHSGHGKHDRGQQRSK